MTPNKILVTGATGNIGRHVVTGLHARGAAVRVFSRTPAAGALPDGVEAVSGDLTRAETLRPALSGVDAVFLLWPFFTVDGAAEVVEAVAEHARRVVYVSSLNVRDDRSPADNGVWGEVEDAIRRTGLEWTFLRVGGMATNTLEWFPAIRAGLPVRMPFARAGRSLIHERDIADVAVLALTEDGHAGRSYRLTGPEVLTQAEQAGVIGAVAGRPARVEELAKEEALADMAGWDPAYAEAALTYWESLVDTPEPVTPTVREVTGTPARTFEQWARDHLASAGPPS
jgi:uncharacterized protein YbjT (DUF2867 family)